MLHECPMIVNGVQFPMSTGPASKSEPEYISCGGCGARRPQDRCIGCLHYFGGGSWDTRRMFSEDTAMSAEPRDATS
jgi:hypothetical protein